MKVVRPIEITEAVLTSSSIPEPDASVGEVEWIDGRKSTLTLAPEANKNIVSGCFVSDVGYVFLSASVPDSGVSSVDIYNEDMNLLSSESIDNSPIGYNLMICSEYDESEDLYFSPTVVVINESSDEISLVRYSDDMTSVISTKTASLGFSASQYNLSRNGTMTDEHLYFSGYQTTDGTNPIDGKNNIYKLNIETLDITDTSPPVNVLTRQSDLMLIANSSGISAISRIGSDIQNAYILNRDLSLSEKKSITPALNINTRFITSTRDKLDVFNGAVFVEPLSSSEEYLHSYVSDGVYKVDERAIKLNNHKLYQCTIPTFEDPEIGVEQIPQTWVEVGPTNKWAAFDDKTSTTSKSSDSYTVTISPESPIDSIAAAGISGASEVNILVTSPESGVIYNETISLIDIGSVTDFYGYFFYKVDYVSEFTVIDIPINPLAEVKITFTGDDINVGRIAAGRKKTLGVLNSGVSSDRIDYSKSKFDEFGELIYVPRPIVKYSTYPVAIEKQLAPSIESYLDSIKGVQAVWIGDIGNNQFLTTFGAIERSPLVYDNLSIVEYQIKVRGSI